MKICNTPTYRNQINRAIRKIKRNKIKCPRDGMMVNIIDEYTRRGKWQVEYIKDLRMYDKPYIAAYFFKKCGPFSQTCLDATGALYKEYEN